MQARNTYKDSTTKLSTEQLEELNSRISDNADKWLKENFPQARPTAPRQPKTSRGRKPKIIRNPFFGFIGCVSFWGRYPVFAESVMEGAARLDWHDRPIGKGGKSMPLSVRNIAVILESLPVISNEAVEDLLQLGERHARRYFKAMQLIIPEMMESRPRSLINEMDGIEPEPKACEWEDRDNACAPSAEELDKLHRDLRTLTEYKTTEEYEAEFYTSTTQSNSVNSSARQQHPMKAQVLQMLLDGATCKAVERETSVSAKTIRKWRNEILTAQGPLQAA